MNRASYLPDFDREQDEYIRREALREYAERNFQHAPPETRNLLARRAGAASSRRFDGAPITQLGELS